MKLWDLAGTVYREAIYQGQMMSAGSNVHRLTEKMKSDSGYITKQGRMVQILGSFYLLVVSVLSVVGFVELRTGTASEWNLLIAALSTTVQLLIQTGYLVMLTILATAEILAPDLYRWPASLPLSREQIGTLKVLALTREFLLPIAIIVLSTPLVAGIAGGSIAVGLVGLVVSVAHAALTVGVAVLAAWRLRKSLRGNDTDDRKSTIARVLAMVVYGVGTLLVVFVMQIGSSVLANLFNSPSLEGPAVVRLLQVLALVPLPTAPALLLTSMTAGKSGLALAAWMPVVGTLGYLSLAAIVVRRAARLVITGVPDTVGEEAAERSEAGSAERERGTERRPVRVRSPRDAFRRQIARAMTRDTQVLITMLFPMILPLLATLGPAVSGGAVDVASVTAIVMAGAMGSWMVIHGVTRLQFGSGGLEATLPIRERDRVFPRLWLAAVLPTVGALVPVLALLERGSLAQQDGLVQALAVLCAGPAGLLLKLRLFGRVRSGSNPIVLDEVNTGARFWKWAAVVVLLLVISIAIVVGQPLLTDVMGATSGRLVFVGAVGVVLLVETWVARRMFR